MRQRKRDKTRQDKTRQDKTRQDKRREEKRREEKRREEKRQDEEEREEAWPFLVGGVNRLVNLVDDRDLCLFFFVSSTTLI